MSTISKSYTKKINKTYQMTNCIARELDDKYKTINYEMIDFASLHIRSLFSILSLLNNNHIKFINAPSNVENILRKHIKNTIIQLINGDDDYLLLNYCKCYSYAFGYDKEIFNYLIKRLCHNKHINDARTLLVHTISHKNEFPKEAIIEFKLAIINNYDLDDFLVNNSNLIYLNKVDKLETMKLIFNYNYSFYNDNNVQLNITNFFEDLPSHNQLGIIL